MKYPNQYKQNFKKISKLIDSTLNFNVTNLYGEGKTNYFFRSPQLEKGALDIVSNVFPSFKGKIESKIDLSKDTVDSENRRALYIACKEKHVDPTIKDDLYNASMEVVNECMHHKKSYGSIRNSYDSLNKSTSSCYPRYGKKGDLDVRKESIEWMRKFLQIKDHKRALSYLYTFPVTVFNRLSPKLKQSIDKYWVNYKVRQVFGVPAFICALEHFFFKDTVKNFFSVYSDFNTIGLTRFEVSGRITRIRSYAKRKGHFIVPGDLSNCDLSVTPFSLCLMSNFLILTSGVEHFTSKIAVLRYLVNTPIMYRGTRFLTKGINVSGSYMTTFVNTFMLIVVFRSFFKDRFGRMPVPGDFLVHGDDFLICVRNKDDAKALKIYLKRCNLTLKIFTSPILNYNDDIEYLGFLWDVNSAPFADDEWFVRKILFPEAYVDDRGPDRIITRYLSLIFLVRNYNELFNRFLKYDEELRLRFKHMNFKFTLFKYNKYLATMKVPIDKLLSKGWKLT